MPKKNKKTILRKPISRKPKKDKNVNVTINIDNSKKTTARRTAIKPSNMQPFVNFPSYQPARIQQLEPLKKYNNGDLTKIDDMYQKQFKTYLETTDKSVKDIIEKFDDNLKKNTAPQKKEESKPGASNVYATDEGETVFTEPISKVGHNNWSKRNELKQNTIAETTAETIGINQLFEPQEVKPLNIKEVVRGLPVEDLDIGVSEAHDVKIERNIIKKYEEYVSNYKQFYNNDNYEKSMVTPTGKIIPAATWGVKNTAIKKKIKKYKTYKEQIKKESDLEVQRNIRNLNNLYEGLPTYEE